MTGLILIALAGFGASFIDGALGMAFGVIMNTLLVGFLGVPPAVASQRVHVVECFTTAMSGLSHLFHRNIDARLFFRLLILPWVAHAHPMPFFGRRFSMNTFILGYG